MDIWLLGLVELSTEDPQMVLKSYRNIILIAFQSAVVESEVSTGIGGRLDCELCEGLSSIAYAHDYGRLSLACLDDTLATT